MINTVVTPVSSVGDMTGVAVLGRTTGALTRINNTLRGGAAHIVIILMTDHAVVVGNTLGMRLQTLDYRVAYRMTVITR